MFFFKSHAHFFLLPLAFELCMLLVHPVYLTNGHVVSFIRFPALYYFMLFRVINKKTNSSVQLSKFYRFIEIFRSFHHFFHFHQAERYCVWHQSSFRRKICIHFYFLLKCFRQTISNFYKKQSDTDNRLQEYQYAIVFDESVFF